MLIGADQARERIEPIEGVLVDAHKAATATWSELVREQPGFAVVLDPTARANIIHCHLRLEIGQRLVDRQDAVVNDRLGFYALLLRPDVLLRVKYVGNSDGAPHNYPTRQQQLLAKQSYDPDMLQLLGMEGSFAPPTFLTCGYTLDELDLGRIEIRFDCVGHLPWSFNIYGEDTLIEPLVLDGMADDTKPARVASSRTSQRKGAEQAESE
jgi:hypothetical protein